MTVALLVLGLLVAIVLSGFFSGSEMGVYCLDRVRLRVALDKGDPSAARLKELVRRPEDLVITTLLGTNVADYVATACVTAALLSAVSATMAEVYATAIVTPLILVFGGIIPKDRFRRDSNRFMSLASRPLMLSLRLARFTGLVWMLRNLTHVLVRWIDPGQASREADLLPRARIARLLREGAARRGLSTMQRDLIERVLNLSSVRVRDVMVPRARAAILALDVPRADFLRVARMAHFSRLPVYHGEQHHVVGVVNVYDIITDEQQRPIAEHARPPLMIADGVSVSAALLEMQRAREAMAIVRDHAGRCIGLLTIKDLVEEVVGDLEAW